MGIKRALWILPWLCVGAAAAHPGWGIVVDRAGNVYYTDLAQVWRIGTDGTKSVVVPDVHTHELLLDAEGTLHGEHLWYDNKTSKWGYYDWRLAQGKLVRDPPHEGFRANESFVRDAGGAMYWVEGSRIRKRAPGGEATDLATVPRPPDRPGEARGGILTVGEDGVLYLLFEGDLLRVQPDGQIRRIAGGLNEHVWTAFTTQPWHYTMGLTADAQGNVYLANSGARKVKKVAPDGLVTVVLKASFPWAPTGIALRQRELYVLEYTDGGGSARVRKVSMDGKISVLP